MEIRRMFARASQQGTACIETALCEKHYTVPNALAFANPWGMSESDRNAPFSTYADCSGNEALSCNVCGYTEPPTTR